MAEVKKIELHNLESMGQELVESCNLLREKQDEMETTLNEISRNESDFRAGKVAKQAFEFNHQKFSQEADREKKDVTQQINAGLKVVENLEKLVKSQDMKLPEEILPPKKRHHAKAHHHSAHHKAHHAKHHAKRHGKRR